MPDVTSYHLLETGKPPLVERDHLPRVARYRAEYDDGSQGETQHVLYWGGQIVQSMLAADWLAQRGALPTDPTQQESDAGVVALAQAEQQARQDTAQLRQQVLNLANSAVGVAVNALTAAQVRALVALLLLKAGALNTDGTVRPLTDWIDRTNSRTA